LGSFRKIDFFEPIGSAPWCLRGALCGASALQHGERAVEGAVGRHLVAQARRELGPLCLREDQAAHAPEERRLRARGLPTVPSRADHHIGEPFLPVIARRQRCPHIRLEAVEVFDLFIGHRVSARRQPVPQGIPARRPLARGSPGASALEGVPAVGGDLGGSSHGFESFLMNVRNVRCAYIKRSSISRQARFDE